MVARQVSEDDSICRMDLPDHYPPELLSLLVDTIPRLARSKPDVLLFFRGAGVAHDLYRDLEARLASAPKSLNKFDLARTVLSRLNEGGDKTLRPRREVLKRVIEFEDFSTCWPEDQLKAKGLVAEIRRVINVKDSFARLHQQREEELAEHRRGKEKEAQQRLERRSHLDDLRGRFSRLFAAEKPQERGKLLEGVLNDIFRLHSILVREAFERRSDKTNDVLEQVDGVVELDGHLYLVEMKWLKDSVGVGDVSHHLVRIYHRGSSRGIFISTSNYSPAALATCTEALTKTVVVLCSLSELYWLLENDKSLLEFFRRKVQQAVVDKNPQGSVSDLL